MYNPGANSGCSWYFVSSHQTELFFFSNVYVIIKQYPKENINASRAPAGTPLSPHPELQYTATAWVRYDIKKELFVE